MVTTNEGRTSGEEAQGLSGERGECNVFFILVDELVFIVLQNEGGRLRRRRFQLVVIVYFIDLLGVSSCELYK